MPVLVKCVCGKAFKAPDKLAGKRVKCPGCQAPVLIGAARGEPKEEQTVSSKGISSPASSTGKQAKGPSCSQCGKSLEAESVVCTHCGFNMKTGKNVGRTTTDEENVSDEELTLFIVGGVMILGGIIALIYYFVF